MSTRLIVKQVTAGEGEQLIADVPDYDGPTPFVGMYLFHPPLHPQDGLTEYWDGGIAGCVKKVCASLYGRPQNGEKHFTGLNTNIIVAYI
jgi:hypothetical protein